MTFALVQRITVQEHPVHKALVWARDWLNGALCTWHHLFSPTELPGTCPEFPQGGPHRTGTRSACFLMLSPLLPAALLPQHVLEWQWTSPFRAPSKWSNCWAASLHSGLRKVLWQGTCLFFQEIANHTDLPGGTQCSPGRLSIIIIPTFLPSLLQAKSTEVKLFPDWILWSTWWQRATDLHVLY